MKSHLLLAKILWKNHIKKGDLVIDATLGNGQDFWFLTTLLFPSSTSYLYGIDIQEKALQNTRELLKKNSFYSPQVHLLLDSHVNFPNLPQKASLIVYNLGYLPGADKSLTTTTDTTLKSVEKVLTLLTENGAISLMLYPGHEEGKKEKNALLSFLQKIPDRFSITHHENLRNPKAPSLIWIQNRDNTPVKK